MSALVNTEASCHTWIMIKDWGLNNNYNYNYDYNNYNYNLSSQQTLSHISSLIATYFSTHITDILTTYTLQYWLNICAPGCAVFQVCWLFSWDVVTIILLAHFNAQKTWWNGHMIWVFLINRLPLGTQISLHCELGYIVLVPMTKCMTTLGPQNCMSIEQGTLKEQ